MESGLFSLKWTDFHQNLSDGFISLMEDESLVDVTLGAEGKFIQAHKLVLSVSSPYFKDLFKINTCKHPVVLLKDVKYSELCAIVQFMYKGEVNVQQDELAEFLKTAESLQVKGLEFSNVFTSATVEAPVILKPPELPLPGRKSKKMPCTQQTDVGHGVVGDSESSNIPSQPLKRSRRKVANCIIPLHTTNTPSFEMVTIKKELVNQPGYEVDGERDRSRFQMQDFFEGSDDLPELHDFEDYVDESMEQSCESLPAVPEDSSTAPTPHNNMKEGVYLVQIKPGRQLLICHGYIFRADRHCADRVYWRCRGNAKVNCKARCMTYNGKVVKNKDFHCHEREKESTIRRTMSMYSVVYRM